MSTKKQSDPWAAMDALMRTKPEPVGAEWFTVEQFRARYDLTNRQARDRLTKLQHEKRIEIWKGTSRECRRTLVKYRLI